MSAWLCSQDLINLIVNAHTDGDEYHFDMLLAENLRSLRYRYSDISDWEEEAKTYKYEAISPNDLVRRVYEAQSPETAKYYPAVSEPITDKLVRAQIAQSCACFNYQACETPDYEGTDAAMFVQEVADNYEVAEARQARALWSF